MKTLPLLVICMGAALLLMATPAAGSPALSGVAYLPSPPLVPGGQQHVAARYALTPTATCSFAPSGTCTFEPGSTCQLFNTGPCTFDPGHELQMQTALSNARWTVRVLLDGQTTATQTARGSAAFLNGYLLSYSSYHDVAFSVAIDGTVPQGAGPEVMLLQVEEIDNSNHIVPGSGIVISQPLEGQPATTGPVPLPTLTPTPAPSSVPTARSPGLSLPAAVAALGLGLLLIRRRA